MLKLSCWELVLYTQEKFGLALWMDWTYLIILVCL
jgi:hypothetical protein